MPPKPWLLSSDSDLQEKVELFEIINLFNELSFILTFQIVTEYAQSFANILAIISEVADKSFHPMHFSLIVCCSAWKAGCCTCISYCSSFLVFLLNTQNLFLTGCLNSSSTNSHVNMIYPHTHGHISHV